MAYGYGKRPMWQWVLIYLVIGGIVYGVIYYFMFAGKGSYGGDGAPAPSYQMGTQY